jgi:small-conductance mechanosensitive channel
MPAIPLQGLPQIPTGPQQLISQIVNQYGSALVGFAVDVLTFALVFLVVYMIARIVFVRATKRVLSARGFDQAVLDLAGSLAAAIALFGAFALAAAAIGFGSVFAGFATILGALSLALGFAAQDLIGNFVAGIFVLRDKPFRVGDWIEWNDTAGVVQDIQLRVTKLETFNNELITVPNSELADNAVKNPVAKEQLRVPFTFGIGYEDDIERAKNIIIQEATTVDSFDGDGDPDVIVTELGDSAVGLTGRAHIAEPNRGKYANALSEWVEAVKNRFDSEGIDMPYPYTELTGTLDVADAQREEAASADD